MLVDFAKTTRVPYVVATFKRFGNSMATKIEKDVDNSTSRVKSYVLAADETPQRISLKVCDSEAER